MNRLSISKQILIIAILPALIVAAILSVFYTLNQIDYISESLNKNGDLLAKQLSPAAEYAVYSGNLDLLDSLISTIINNNPVSRIQILDRYNNSILDITPEHTDIESKSIFNRFFVSEEQLIFKESIMSKPLDVDDNSERKRENSEIARENKIGEVIVTLTNRLSNQEKITQIEHMLFLTLAILLSTTLLIFRLNKVITRPITSLTNTVREITGSFFKMR